MSRPWRLALVFGGFTVGAAFMGLLWGDAALVGLVATVVTAVVAVVGAADDDEWPRWREPQQAGTRRDVMALTWSFIGREGRVAEAAVRRLRSDATRRLAARGVVVPGGLGATTRSSPEVPDDVRAQVRALLGDRAWFILTSPGGTMPSITDVAHCVEVVESLEPPRPDLPGRPRTAGTPGTPRTAGTPRPTAPERGRP